MEGEDHMSGLPSEILEKILLHVPACGLIALRKTHRRFRTMIDSVRMEIEPLDCIQRLIGATLFRGDSDTRIIFRDYKCVISATGENKGLSLHDICKELLGTSRIFIVKVVGRVDQSFLHWIQAILAMASYLIMKCKVAATTTEVLSVTAIVRGIRSHQFVTVEQSGVVTQPGHVAGATDTVDLLIRAPHYYTPQTLMEAMKKDTVTAINAEIVHMTYEECRDFIKGMERRSLLRTNFCMPRSGNSEDDAILLRRLSEDFNVTITVGKRYSRVFTTKGRSLELELQFLDRTYMFELSSVPQGIPRCMVDPVFCF